ncbi:hypothetical protein PILCRDRAFT_3924 [Piloderma croceum F 1598]|uniref:NAD(P)-binding protein n=1 Tax=Piloderma croceum (strain F 1598) TaxID=765440 RepID=A0A0C3G6M6_PILCF|nr:hypothetical protein PILCRDRAFT_3924 [Piloderma croceum F 1598]
MSTPTLAILITGSNQGLGFETARHLSKHPHIHLFISGRNPSRVQEAQENITKEEDCKAVIDNVVIDVSDDASIKAGVKEVEAKLNGAALDVLVNNAGVGFDRQIETLGLRTAMEKTYATNVFGVAVISESFLPLLKKSTVGPRIVNVGSGVGSLSLMSKKNWISDNLSFIAYNSSKAALSSITCTLAMKNPDIHVTVLNPGSNATNINNFTGTMDPKDGSMLIVQHALERTGKSPGFYTTGGEDLGWFPQRIPNVNLTIYEKNAGMGGAWYLDRYPELACDIPSHCVRFFVFTDFKIVISLPSKYQLSFEENSALYAPDPEICAYLEGIVDKYKLMQYIRLQHELVHARYDELTAKRHLRPRRPVVHSDPVNSIDYKEIEDMADVLFAGLDGLSRWT